MRALGLDLNIATAMISALVFGIGIDYSIHYMECVHSARSGGRSSTDALLFALSETGLSILETRSR